MSKVAINQLRADSQTADDLTTEELEVLLAECDGKEAHTLDEAFTLVEAAITQTTTGNHPPK
jgi:hypothetical protein